MASTSVTFDILARDHASSALNKIGGSATSTGSKFSKMAKVATVATVALGGGAILAGKALVSMAKNALDDQEAHRRLTIALKNTTGATDAQVASVEKWISAQGVALGVTDDELRPALQRLVQATGDISKAQNLVSIAMDVSAGSGKSLKTVTEALTKAQLGSTGGLARLGAKTKDAEGNALSLQQVTKSLADTYSGQASKAAQSATGKFKRLSLIFDETKEAIGYRLLPIASALAGFILNKAIPAFDQLGGKIREVSGKIKEFAQQSGLGGLAKKIKDAFGKIDISNLGKGLAEQAKSWAAPVIEGFKQGLDTGDWTGLGEALGNGIVKAVQGAGNLLGKIADKLSAVLSKVDWVGIGIAMGKQAPLLVAGLAIGILNVDLLALLKGLAAHWQEALFAVITIAFTPAKFIGKVGEVLAKIPFVGKLLEWGLLAFKRFSDRLVGWAFDALKFMGRSFLTGFRRVFPEVGARFAEHLALFPIRVQLMGIKLAEKGLKMIRGLGSAIARGTGAVIAKIGELIAKMLKPWVNANSWLIRHGVEFIGGLIKGIASKVGDLLAPLRQLGGKAVSAVGNLSSRLFGAGVDLIKGLISGISSQFGAVKGKLGDLTNKLTSWKGPPAKDRGLLRSAGRSIMDGLIAGFADREIAVKNALGRVTDLISKVGDKISNLMSTRSGFMGTFTSDSVFGTDMSAGGGIGALIASQQAQASQASQLATDVKSVTKMGLSKALVRQLQSQGTSGAAALHALAMGSPAQIRQLNALNKQTSDSLRSAGLRAGNYTRGGSIDSDIRTARKQEHILELLEHHLKDLAESEKKGQTIVVKIGEEAIIRAIHRRNTRKGVKSAGM